MPSQLPYPVIAGVFEPCNSQPEIRLVARITTGTTHARKMGYTGVTVSLSDIDYTLYSRVNTTTAGLTATTCDGARIVQLREGASHFHCRDHTDQLVVYPMVTDQQFLAALTLKPGMFVIIDGESEPWELTAATMRGYLCAGPWAYDPRGHPVKQAPSILFAWDKDAIEGKAELGLLSHAEKAFLTIVATNIAHAALQ